MWILLTNPMQKSVTTYCLHCSFARLKNKHTHVGVLGTNVATTGYIVYPDTGNQCSQLIVATLVPSVLVLVSTVTQSHTGLHDRPISSNSNPYMNDGRLATFTNSPQVYKLAPLQSRHINANLPQIHTRPTFSCNAL